MPNQHLLQLSDGKKHPYSISRSKKAKYIRIKLSNSGALTLVVPAKTALKHGEEFIQSKVSWIEKQLKNIIVVPDTLPESLTLKLLEEKWDIIYLEENIPQIHIIEESDFKLMIRGAISNKELIKKGINKWCQFKAKQVFKQMLDEIATSYNFHYRKLTVRSQKTRWGSCSQQKNINLNSKLLFLDNHIVRYVMIHELCHTIEMNHSKQFWSLVKNCDPNYMENRKNLKKDGSLIPL